MSVYAEATERHVSAWKKDKETMVILLDAIHSVNIKDDLIRTSHFLL